MVRMVSLCRKTIRVRSAIAFCYCSMTTKSDDECPQNARRDILTHASIEGMFDGFLSCVLYVSR